jgi:hypothetical protein
MLSAVLAVLAPLALVASACGPVEGEGDNHNDNGNAYSNPACTEVTQECDVQGDDDNDGISNGAEGCECGLDSDGDSLPDYMDRDSDGDGLNDEHEAGDARLDTPPVDTDGDGTPDYLDRDSDDDGVVDGDEDRNNDGRLGNCEDDPEVCNGTCSSAEAYCHPDLGICVDPVCLAGETDPRLADTDGDGVPDGQESTFICNAAGEHGVGRKPVQYQEHSRGLYQVALEMDAVYTPCDPTGFDPGEGAAAFDLTDPEHATAGFVVSRASTDPQLNLDLSALIMTLRDQLGTVVTLSGGTSRLSHALKEQIINVTLAVEPGTSLDPGQLRNQVIAILLDRPLSDFGNFPQASYSSQANRFTLTLMVQRADHARNVIMGGVATYSDWETKDQVAFHLADAAGGACLADTSDTTENECEQYLWETPTVDIVWVVDDSGSMSDDQQKLSDASQNFLNVAASHGLNWRMCVVDMTEDNDGSCCTDTDESGNRWLTSGNPGDDQRFRNCIQDPAGAQSSDGGREYGLTQMETAVQTHLPPQQDSEVYYRPEAARVVFFMTDENANEIDQHDLCPNVPGPNDCHYFSGCIDTDPMGCMQVMQDIQLITQCESYPDGMWNHSECDEVYRCMGDMSEDAWDPVLCDPMLQPWIDFADANALVGYGLAILASDPEDCSPDSSPSPPIGYQQLIAHTGGVLASLCQTDLNTTMELIIEDIAGAASPVVLEHTPIPVSLAVAVERKDPNDPQSTSFEAVTRSRTDGFNYKASANRIVLVGQPMDYPPYEVVVSYSRWVTAVIGPD